MRLTGNWTCYSAVLVVIVCATAFAVDGYAITASFADCKNAAALHHVKQILLSSFANNTVKNSSGDILAIPPEQRDNNSGGSPYVP